MSQEGYIVISDITGYTAFLSGSELEHAEDSLSSLLNLLLDHTSAPLAISRLEGDAVISHAPKGSFLQGQTLVEMLEQTYVAFRQALQRMILNTTCECRACRNITNLDLKFFVHFGAYLIQHLGSHDELVGNDVNLIHRLTKNTITEKTGFKAYAAYTQSAVDDLGIGEMCVDMKHHVENYEHVGSVMTFVQDMDAVWERERNKHRVAVSPEQAILHFEQEFPIGQAQLWEYATKPEMRAILVGSESAEISERSEGRLASGTAYYCAHGNSISVQTIVEWEPFEQYTVSIPVSMGGVCVVHGPPHADGKRRQANLPVRKV